MGQAHNQRSNEKRDYKTSCLTQDVYLKVLYSITGYKSSWRATVRPLLEREQVYKIASAQFGYRFGEQLYYPYSIAVLAAYLNNSQFEFLPCAVDRTMVYAYAEQYANADILLLSCYNWSWEISKVLAAEFKRRNASILVIAGGAQIPAAKITVPNIDVLVYGEGELSLKNILDGYSKGEETPPQVWGADCMLIDLNDALSPYTSGIMHRLVDQNAAKWVATFETTRGCPHGCDYCAWGEASHSKVRQYPLTRIYDEIDWFAKNQVGYIECADANFGMLERDVLIAEYLAMTKRAYGYPRVFKPSWSKKITARVYRIAATLKDAGLLLSAGCSLQSLNPDALKKNHRVSVGFDEFKTIVDTFKQSGAQTFTELIRGLPGETLDSFKDGLNKIIFESNVDTVYIYNCTALENTQLKARGYPTVHSPLYFAHASPDPIAEYEDLLIASETFTQADLERMYLYSWYMLAFQHLGILNYITQYLKQEHDVPYELFWQRFQAYCQANTDSLFGREYWNASRYIADGYAGRGWTGVYPLDEATWLRVTQDQTELQQAMRELVAEDLIDIVEDLIRFQLFTLSHEDNPPVIIQQFDFDWKRYFTTGRLEQRAVTFAWDNKITQFTDSDDWNKQAIWYGRRKITYKVRLEDIREQI